MDQHRRRSSAGQKEDSRRIQVAIVGTGLAGLTTAHLLHNDARGRYEVTLFEQASRLAFDAASVSVENKKTGVVDRIDLPMRASTGGYYVHLLRMYRHLGIRLHPLRLSFAFASARATFSAQSGADEDGARRLRPERGDGWILGRLLEIWYLIACYLWFSLACLCVPPRTSRAGRTTSGADAKPGAKPAVDGEPVETFSHYLQRIRLPRRFTNHYLLPVICIASTCSHAEALSFPATDIVNYENRSRGQPNYTVCGGVHQVQSRLADGLADVRLACRVVAVKAVTTGDGAVVRWLSGPDAESEKYFDRVVLAVSPDVASRLFRPLRSVLSGMPTLQTESSILLPGAGETHATVDDAGPIPSGRCCHDDGNRLPPEDVSFRTVFSASGARTESLHRMPGGVLISTCSLDPHADGERALHTATFTRTLRTLRSRAVVQGVMRASPPRCVDDEPGWVNGQDNVWLVGAWCWDGLVLLEGCVVSAMKVADDFGVEVPWRQPATGCQGMSGHLSALPVAAWRQLSLAVSLAVWAVTQASAATSTELQRRLKHPRDRQLLPVL
ncbi:hypothetical protein RJ55_02038 [Drechmeria coniospora]|nr:hypothetical protein RJ55_02038 [Drechmeria coniospora]